MAKKLKITGSHLIATLKNIEASSAAVRQVLESLPDPDSLVFHCDPKVTPMSASMAMTPGSFACELKAAEQKLGPHLNAPGACGVPPRLGRKLGDPVEKGVRTSPAAPQVRRGKGSEPGH